MKPRWHANKGFTLVELLVASTVMTIVLTSVCGVYFTVARGWERQQGEADALGATSRACARLNDYISQAVSATVLTRFRANDTLAVNLPADTANGGIYVPTWNGSTFTCRSGNWIVFYLSDTSGSYSRQGDILWAATMSWTNFPSSVVPGQSWSLERAGGPGRITPLSTLQFQLTSDTKPKVTVAVSSSYKLNGTYKSLSLTTAVCLRNAP
ncbi:MAG: prepilin-type N-terminal cleavage/methylation domain-containing protein [Armatimonadota bacterium]|nr:prepilin-type N-terminal cleavage/methylation domain-containing protein [bacterium]